MTTGQYIAALKQANAAIQRQADKIAGLETVLKRLLDVTLWVDSGCKQLGAAEKAAREVLKEQSK